MLTITEYDLAVGNVIDYMHCVLLGITKMLLKNGLTMTIVENSGTVAEADAKLLHQLTSVEYQEVFSITKVTGRHL